MRRLRLDITKAALVDLDRGEFVDAASHPTTLPGRDDTGDVLDGFEACLAVLAAARGVVAGGWRGPVVVAGNIGARTEVATVLAGLPVVLADNVVPRIGVLAPDSARAAIREMFLSHVIGGKHLSSRVSVTGDAFTEMVRGATPDVVLTGVELLVRGLGPEAGGGGDRRASDTRPQALHDPSRCTTTADAGPSR